MEITRNVYLSLGSNEGDRLFNLHRAIDLVAAHKDIRVIATSSIYETAPVGYTDQASFLNAVAEIETSQNPFQLLTYVKTIEERVGREKSFRWGPRKIDIDIVLFGQQVIDDPELMIPHREMHQRKFVLVPLSEIAPHYSHPIKQLTIKQLLRHCTDDRVEKHSSFQSIET